MREVNYERHKAIGFRPFTGKSYLAKELAEHPDREADYIAATPRMAEYIRVSSQIYGIYLKYIAPGTSTSIPSTRSLPTSLAICNPTR